MLTQDDSYVGCDLFDDVFLLLKLSIFDSFMTMWSWALTFDSLEFNVQM